MNLEPPMLNTDKMSWSHSDIIGKQPNNGIIKWHATLKDYTLMAEFMYKPFMYETHRLKILLA